MLLPPAAGASCVFTRAADCLRVLGAEQLMIGAPALPPPQRLDEKLLGVAMLLAGPQHLMRALHAGTAMAVQLHCSASCRNFTAHRVLSVCLQQTTAFPGKDTIRCQGGTFWKDSWKVRPKAMASPTLFICVVSSGFAPGNFSNAKRGICAARARARQASTTQMSACRHSLHSLLSADTSMRGTSLFNASSL